MKAKLKRVLIVEDNRIVRAVLREFFEKLGVDVVEAEDGVEGLELAQTTAPQLMVMDLLMPGKTGFEVAEEIDHFGLPSLPILFFATAVYKSGRWEQESLKDYGAAEFLRKPIEPADLLERVKKYFEV